MDLTKLKSIFDNYLRYKEQGLDFLRVTYSDISSKIGKAAGSKAFTVNRIGTSIEGRPVNIIKAGAGKRKILLWSQMHGNESTATRAIFDLLNFLSADDEFNPIRNDILNNLELYFIPMLNPDGAERFSRENAINIDLNRDAKRLQSPEAAMLKTAKENISPEFCFNLHDQNPYYSVGKTDLSPAVSFLAPPYDFDDSVNPPRKKAMQLIAQLNSLLQEMIPGRISKYADDHEPRSFGDNFVMADSSVVLIESGFLIDDPVKEKIRSLNFLSLLTSFCSIIDDDYNKFDVNSYYDIPKSEERFFDLLLKNAALLKNGYKFIVDIGIKQKVIPVEETKDFYYEGSIAEIGDLSTLTGHRIIDCEGLTASGGRIFCPDKPFMELPEKEEMEQILNSGFTTIRIQNNSHMGKYICSPVNIMLDGLAENHEIAPEFPANFVLSDELGIKHIIVNGYITPVPVNKNFIRNGLIFR